MQGAIVLSSSGLLLLQAVYLFSRLLFAAGVSALVLRFDWLRALKRPIDGGLEVGGRRILGEHKTWRGLVVTTAACMVWVALQKLVQPLVAPHAQVADYGSLDPPPRKDRGRLAIWRRLLHGARAFDGTPVARESTQGEKDMTSRASTQTGSGKANGMRGDVGPGGQSPRAVDRDQKLELAYVLAAVVVFIALTVSASYVWAVAWFMASFFAFGVWRVARGRFR